MNTASHQTIGNALREYSALADTWWPDAGDTHELLAAREELSKALNGLSAEEVSVLDSADEKVLSALQEHQESRTWDVAMLRRTQSVIASDRSSRAAIGGSRKAA